jgi:hypothetical protein
LVPSTENASPVGLVATVTLTVFKAKFAVTLSAAFMVIVVLGDVGLATESGLDVHLTNA